MRIQWYSPTSAKWSKTHLSRRDWLSSNPDHEVTVCGRKPRKQHCTIRESSHSVDCKRCTQ